MNWISAFIDTASRQWCTHLHACVKPYFHYGCALRCVASDS